MTMTIHADYQAFYQRVQSKPDETVYSEIEEGLDRMAGGKSVVHITDLILYYHFVNNPTIPGMHIFAEGRPTMKGPLLTKNSPLGIADLNQVSGRSVSKASYCAISGPIFSTALLQLKEQGAVDRALKEFKGADPMHKASETLVLSAGQTLLVFILIGIGALTAILVFALELIFRRCNLQVKQSKLFIIFPNVLSFITFSD